MHSDKGFEVKLTDHIALLILENVGDEEIQEAFEALLMRNLNMNRKRELISNMYTSTDKKKKLQFWTDSAQCHQGS